MSMTGDGISASGNQKKKREWQAKDKVPVVVYPVAGAPVVCSIFCGADELVTNVINQPQPFLLVETEAGSVSLIKKTQIQKLIPEESQSLIYMMASAEGERISITFLGGLQSHGVIFLPNGMRASDIANSPDPFFLYRPDDEPPEYICNHNIQQITIDPR